jgi:hypothetical protein
MISEKTTTQQRNNTTNKPTTQPSVPQCNPHWPSSLPPSFAVKTYKSQNYYSLAVLSGAGAVFSWGDQNGGGNVVLLRWWVPLTPLQR